MIKEKLYKQYANAMGAHIGATPNQVANILAEVKENGYGSEILYSVGISSLGLFSAQEIENGRGGDLGRVYLYRALGQQRQGTFAQLTHQDQIQQNFGTTSILEHYQAFFRYKITKNHKLQDLFGYFEGNVRPHH